MPFTCSPTLTLLLEKASSHHNSPPQGEGLETLSLQSTQQACKTSLTLGTTRDISRADVTLQIPNCREKKK